MRAAVEEEIDRLIDLLDAFDDDPDVEPDEDFEPSIAGGGGIWIGDRFETDLESDGLESGEFDFGDYDADDHIPGGGYHT